MRKVLFAFLTLLLFLIPLTACSKVPGNGKESAAAEPSSSAMPAWKQQVEQIDEQIKKLVNQRNLHLSRATRYQNQGDRLQFNHQNLIDARMAWQQAQINREIAARLQQEIELLEQQRKNLLDKAGIKNYPPPPSQEKTSN